MAPLLDFPPLVDRWGWILVHSVWQLTLVALAAMLLDHAMRRWSAANRYRMLLLALLAMVMLPATTMLFTPTSAARTASEGSGSASAASRRLAANRRTRAASDDGASNSSAAVPGSARTSQDTAIGEGAVNTDLDGRESSRRSLMAAWRFVIERAVQPWLSMIVAVWGLGVLAFAWRPALSWNTVRRLRRVGVASVPERIATGFQGVARRLGLQRSVQILQSTLVKAPVVVGHVRPVILLPMSIISNLPISQLEAILAHELAHIRRHDYAVNLLQTLIETIFFYHPGIWWLSRRIRNERENCCDDIAVAVDENRVAYGRALLALEELRGAPTVLAVGSHGGSLLHRIQRVLGLPPKPQPLPIGSALAFLLLAAGTIAVGICASLSATAQPPAEPEEPRVVAGQPGDDRWPQWGGSPARNNVCQAVDLAATWNLETGENVQWTAPLGDFSFGSPVVSSGKVLIGTNNGACRIGRYPQSTDLACLHCFDEQTGEFLWQYSSEKLPSGRTHDWPSVGLCSTPRILGDRVWITTNRCEVVCLDLNGFVDGQNDGPVTDEVATEKNEADVVWRFSS